MVAKNNFSLASHTSLLCHPVDPWVTSVTGQREESPAKDLGWEWLQAYLYHNINPEMAIDMRHSLPRNVR